MVVQVSQLVGFSFGLGGLRCDDDILLASSRFDLNSDLLWAWSSGSVAVVGGDADGRNWYLCKFSKRCATSWHGCNGASAIGDDGRKTALCGPGRTASSRSSGKRLVDARDLTIERSVMFRTVVPGRTTRSRLTVVRRT